MVVGWLAVHYTPGGAHQSGWEAPPSDRCLMGDDTKYAVIWLQTWARISQQASIKTEAVSTAAFPDEILVWQLYSGFSISLFFKQNLFTVLSRWIEVLEMKNDPWKVLWWSGFLDVKSCVFSYALLHTRLRIMDFSVFVLSFCPPFL